MNTIINFSIHCPWKKAKKETRSCAYDCVCVVDGIHAWVSAYTRRLTTSITSVVRDFIQFRGST